MSVNFSSMTVKELKAYAKDNQIDLGGATTKTKIVAAINDINASISQAEVAEGAIMAPPAVKTSKVSNVITNDEGAMIVRSAENHKKKEAVTDPATQDSSSKVAVWSEGNLHWIGVGHIKKGYNIVTKEASEKWLTRKSIRLATPEEVATYFGK